MMGLFAHRFSVRNRGAERLWDKHFRDWISSAKAEGVDPNDVGDAVWVTDCLAQTLDRCYLAFVPEGGTVLELGPGTGRLTRHLIGRAGRIELVDNSEFVIKWITAYLSGKVDFRANLIQAPVLHHLQDDSMDTVVAHGVFEHLDFDETYWFLVEFRRVLKPAGYVSFNYDTLSSPGGTKWFLEKRRKPGAKCVFRFYTPDFMARIAEVAGLSVVYSFTSDDRLAQLVLTKPSQ